jgi:hypothetical protein
MPLSLAFWTAYTIKSQTVTYDWHCDRDMQFVSSEIAYEIEVLH